ncbi:MAG TPA: cbb3-type cytochrome c oxidase subunit I [Pirellulaceae bacterium]|nr:cbb3-type cytochrome c oxidase subunit I [Pirellulaceae bacterium]HMO92256.1 cbb3-type cytochrome c oxidase subunit I [Pirellulaceae bacterium]HMP70072.1 cbb3-type cytochrome c oxidase subunit I [Pirellulaceae bacterium]
MSNPSLAQQYFGHAAQHNYLNVSKGWKSWAFTLDHKRIGVMYLIGVTFALLLAGVFALLLRAELFTPNKMFLSEAQYNQMFTLHGAIMVFAFIIPSIPAALGNFVLPMMLGAKDVAFPRLNLMSFYLWVIGTIFLVIAMITNSLDTGWTFYTPYSIRTSTGVVAATFGAFVLGFSSIFTGINFLVTVHTMRAPGMGWFQMPLFIWGLYATAIIQVLATPVLGITLLMLIAERLLHIGIFDPKYGGDPVLFQHFFWFYSHPAVYIMILPGMGVISELISVYSRKKIFGYSFIAFSSVAIAILGFLVWGHHMFTSGQSELVTLIFSAITFTVAIPSAVKVFNWLSTMYKGCIALVTPMLFAMSFIFLFGIGGLTGLFLATLRTDIHLHDTYFVVAHFHYVMVGGTLTALFGGLFHWWPKMFGRMYNELCGKITCLLVFVGFNVTFFPQFVMGSRGMPRRYARYDIEFEAFHQWSTIGAMILGVGVVIGFATLVYAAFRGPRCAGNPFGAATLEWQSSSPPSFHNFDHKVEFTSPYDFSTQVYDEELDSYVHRNFTAPAKPAVPVQPQSI